MADGKNTELVVKYLPRLIEAVRAWWKRRKDKKAEKPDTELPPDDKSHDVN